MLPPGAGTISPSPDSVYEEDSAIRLEAIPNENYDFVNWFGDIDTTQNPVIFTVNKHYSITANFDSSYVRFDLKIKGEATTEYYPRREKKKYYKKGSEIFVVGLADRGWYFSEFRGDTAEFEELDGYYGGGHTLSHLIIEKDTELEIVFEKGLEFEERKEVSTNAQDAETIHMFDYDDDGDNDLLVDYTYYTGSYWLENLGNGNFEKRENLPWETSKIYLVDIDNDGDQDVVTSSDGLYKNLGHGNYKKLDSRRYRGIGDVADINSDGYIDLVSFDLNQDEVAWYKNNGGNGFDDKQIITNTASSVSTIAADDLNNDDAPDILIFARGTSEFYWLENVNGTFKNKNSFPGNGGAEGFITVDVDQDNDIDVVTRGGAVFFNNGFGEFTIYHSFGSSDYRMTHLGVSEFDDNEQPDLYLLISGQSPTVHLNMGSGFSPAIVLDRFPPRFPNSLTSGDLDGDGDMDLIYSSKIADSIWWLENKSN